MSKVALRLKQVYKTAVNNERNWKPTVDKDVAMAAKYVFALFLALSTIQVCEEVEAECRPSCSLWQSTGQNNILRIIYIYIYI
jgi:hypothetical protein